MNFARDFLKYFLKDHYYFINHKFNKNIILYHLYSSILIFFDAPNNKKIILNYVIFNSQILMSIREKTPYIN